jgi:hypothetical protein
LENLLEKWDFQPYMLEICATESIGRDGIAQWDFLPLTIGISPQIWLAVYRVFRLAM